MPYVLIEDFRFGLDSRRSRIAAQPGSLAVCKNAHITRGGEIEKRKAFSSYATLPANTFGMEATSTGLVVFGSVAAPSMPAGVTYQRLQHPDGYAMTSVVYSTLFQGLPFVLAKYATDLRTLAFYNGTLIGDFINGVVRSSMTNMDGVATALAALIQADGEYTASAAGSVITITGDPELEYSVVATATNGSATDDQTATVRTIQEAANGTAEVRATGTIEFIISETGDGTQRKVALLEVNNVSAISGTFFSGETPDAFALATADAVNNHTSSPDYTATKNGEIVTIRAAAGTGTGPNGYALEMTTGTDVIACTGSFAITGGTGGNSATSITVAGTELLSAPVSWTSSAAGTATAVAANIQAYSGTSGYTAIPDGATVRIGKLVMTSAPSPNNEALVVTATFSTGSVVNVNSTLTAMAGGVAEALGNTQITQVVLGGTFEAGDLFTIAITNTVTSVTKIFGATRVTNETPVAALPFKSKMHLLADSNMFYSALDEVTVWEDDDDSTGSGVINMSSNYAGAEALTALAAYQGRLAVFGRRSIQIWNIDTDDDNNAQIQTLNSIGTFGARGVVSLNETDVLFPADSGIRSLRVRDSSNNAFVSDVGTPIDSLVLTELAALTEAQKALIPAAIEPEDGRYWVAFGTKIFVLSQFPGSKIVAWSQYTLPFSPVEFRVRNGRIYTRGSDGVIYLYGGSAGTTYDTSEVDVQLPYLSAGKPASKKQFNAIDIACEGSWTVSAGFDTTAMDTRNTMGVVTQPTYDVGRCAIRGHGTHIGIKLIHTAAEYARIANLAVHYELSGKD